MLRINMEFRKGILFVRLKGNLTRFNNQTLMKYLLSIINRQGIKYIVFNLANIKIIDNDGRETLKMIINELKKNNGGGLICNTRVKFDDLKIIDNELMAFNLIKI